MTAPGRGAATLVEGLVTSGNFDGTITVTIGGNSLVVPHCGDMPSAGETVWVLFAGRQALAFPPAAIPG